MLNPHMLAAQMMAKVDQLSPEEIVNNRQAFFLALAEAVCEHLRLMLQGDGLIVTGTCPAGAVAGTATAPPGSFK